MIVAMLVPLVAVMVGTALSVIGGSRPSILLPIRGFALAAVVTSVATHLVPEALAATGLWALLAFAIGLWLPNWLGHLGREMAESTRHRKMVSELGFAAVLLHQIGDGVALGTLGTSARAGHSNWDVLVGILAHTIPLAAVVTLPFVARGLRTVVYRATLLVLASAIGVLGARWLGAVHADVVPWFSAAVAGMLLHILAHDEPTIDRPAGLRLIEVIAILAGLALPALLASGHESNAVSSMVALTLSLAPVLVLGLGLTVLLRAMRTPWGLSGQRTMGSGPWAAFSAVFVAIASAIRSPSCACEVAATAPSATVPRCNQLMYLLMAPELHVGTVLATAWLLGWGWAALRVVITVAAAAATVAMMRVSTVAAHPARPPISESSQRHWSSLVLRDQIAETFVHAGPWLAAGIVIATWLTIAPLPSWLTSAAATGSVLALPVAVASIAVATYVCAWSATPVAAVLVAQGMPPQLAIIGLVIGTITNRDVVRVLIGSLGRRAWLSIALIVFALTALATATLAVPALASAFPAVGSPPAVPRGVALAAAAMLSAATLLSLWRYGLSAWLEPLLSDPSGHHHHQHEATEPCRDGCHDPSASAVAASSAPHHSASHDQHDHDHDHDHDHGKAAHRHL